MAGGAGYIGGTGAQALIDRGDRVVIYDSLVHAKRHAVSAGAEFVEGEVADLGRLEALLAQGEFAGVTHSAAQIEAGESMLRPELYF